MVCEASTLFCPYSIYPLRIETAVRRDIACTNVDQVTNFLNAFAKEIDLTVPFTVENPDKVPGQIALHEDGTSPKLDFNAMRRKLDLPVVKQKMYAWEFLTFIFFN